MIPPAPPTGESQVPITTLQAAGVTLQDLFEHLARELFKQLIDPVEVGAVLREKVVVEGPNLQRLLQEWILSLLNLLRIQKMIFGQFQIIYIKTPDAGPCSLLAEVIGELVDPQRHDFKIPVESLLCQEVRLNKDDQGYHAEILLGD